MGWYAKNIKKSHGIHFGHPLWKPQRREGLQLLKNNKILEHIGRYYNMAYAFSGQEDATKTMIRY